MLQVYIPPLFLCILDLMHKPVEYNSMMLYCCFYKGHFSTFTLLYFSQCVTTTAKFNLFMNFFHFSMIILVFLYLLHQYKDSSMDRYLKTQEIKQNLKYVQYVPCWIITFNKKLLFF